MSGSRPVFIVGAHKCGTTSLASWVAQWSGRSLADRKEPNHFSDPSACASDYPGFFDAERFERGHVIDASTTYSIRSLHETTAASIADRFPDALIVYVTRDPIPRIRAAWRQHLDESGYVISADPLVAVREDATLVDATRYHHQLAAYRACFDDDSIFTAPLELVADPDSGTLESLYAFLGGEGACPPLGRENSGADKMADNPAVALLITWRPTRVLLDRLRATPARDLLARARRAVMQPQDPAAADVIDWAMLPDGEAAELHADALAYLDELGLDRGVWPSLSGWPAGSPAEAAS